MSDLPSNANVVVIGAGIVGNAVVGHLADLGWTPMFQQQVSLDEMERLIPARVFAVQRTGLTLRLEGEDGGREIEVPLGGRWFQGSPEDRPTVGDWVLVDLEGPRISRLLDRFGVFKRGAAGT